MYDATNLREDIEEGTVFYAAPFLRNDVEVTDPDADLETVNAAHRFDMTDAWAFWGEEQDSERWFGLVSPNEGGPNGGVVRFFWSDENGELFGHHEAYPRGVEIVE